MHLGYGLVGCAHGSGKLRLRVFGFLHISDKDLAHQQAQVAPLLQRPDLMIGNYEGTLSRGGSSRCSGGPLCYIFQAPPERARNLAIAGFDVMNLANNHALDYGSAARRQSVAALRAAGVVQVFSDMAELPRLLAA